MPLVGRLKQAMLTAIASIPGAAALKIACSRISFPLFDYSRGRDPAEFAIPRKKTNQRTLNIQVPHYTIMRS